MLLQSIGKRQRTVAQSMLAMFMAMWLSAVCQQCMANTGAAGTVTDAANVAAHCMTLPMDAASSNSDQSPCPMDCHCSAMIAATSDAGQKVFLTPSVSDQPSTIQGHHEAHPFYPSRTHVAALRPSVGFAPPIHERFCSRLE